MLRSESICATSEMEAIGVLSSWVMLLMKSVFIRESLFCRLIPMRVKIEIKRMSRLKMTKGAMKPISRMK